MAKPPFMGKSNSATERPSVVKDSDLKSLDNDKDDAGWAGSQEEVDYNAKLTFDESDDSDAEEVKSVRKPNRENEADKKSGVGENNGADKVCVASGCLQLLIYLP